MITTWTIEQLRIFSEVARQESFTRAAEHLSLSQPAVSMQVKALEISVGAILLERRPRKLILTDAGRILLKYAERMASQEAECLAELSDLKKMEGGSLRIGAGATPSIFTLSPIFAEFYRRWPAVELRVQIGRTSELIRKVQMDELDMAIISSAAPSEGLVIKTIYQENCVTIVGSGHPLANNDSVAIEDIASYPLVLLPAESGFRLFLERYLSERNIRLNAAVELASLEAIKEVVKSGALASIVPETSVAREPKESGIYVLSISDAQLVRQTSMVTRQDKYISKSMQAFNRLLSEKWPNYSAR